jgi:hypothetical protein
VATWQQKGDTTLKIAMRDENHIRMDTGEGNYMLVSGEKVYMVTRSEGETNVMDMDQLAGLMSRFGATATGAGGASEHYQSSFKKAGRTETVAGYKGTVYISETKDESGQVIDQSEVVFSKHKDIQRANKAWRTIAMRMGSIIGKDTSLAVDQATEKAEMSGYGGLLRIDEMKLTGVEKPTLSAAYYELPQNAKMTDMPSPTTAGAGQGSETADDSNFVKELGADTGEAAKEEVKNNTIDKVKKGIGGVFKKLF